MSNELYLKYAEVIKMCDGTKLEDTPWVCVRWGGTSFVVGHPKFINPLEEYEFALAIVEDKPVFVGDKVFIKDNRYPNINWENFEYWKDSIKVLSKTWTWQDPNKTFNINGHRLPCPRTFSSYWVSNEEPSKDLVIGGRVVFQFNSIDEAEMAKDTLIRIFRENLK